MATRKKTVRLTDEDFAFWDKVFAGALHGTATDDVDEDDAVLTAERIADRAVMLRRAKRTEGRGGRPFTCAQAPELPEPEEEEEEEEDDDDDDD